MTSGLSFCQQKLLSVQGSLGLAETLGNGWFLFLHHYSAPGMCGLSLHSFPPYLARLSSSTLSCLELQLISLLLLEAVRFWGRIGIMLGCNPWSRIPLPLHSCGTWRKFIMACTALPYSLCPHYGFSLWESTSATTSHR